MRLDQLTSYELKERIKTLNDTIVRIRNYATREDIEALEAEIELIQKEQENRC